VHKTFHVDQQRWPANPLDGGMMTLAGMTLSERMWPLTKETAEFGKGGRLFVRLGIRT
jgi:hypothetical protein